MAGYIGNDPAKSSVRIARQKYTSSASQTDFTFTAGYDPGYLEVYVNGVRQTEGTNFTANDGASFQILNGIGAGNTVTAAAYKSFNLASVSLSEVTDVDNLTITGQIAAATGDIGIATITDSGIDIGVGIITGNGSGLTGLANTDFINAEQLNVIGVTTTGIGTITTSVVVGNAVTVTATAITVDPAVTTTIDGDVNFQGGNYNISRSRANSSIDFDDSATARFGTGADLKIYHDGSWNRIQSANSHALGIEAEGAIAYLRAKINEESVRCNPDASVELFYDNTKRLETSGVGVTVTGICEATSFAGDGSALSGVGGENDITSCLFI